MSKIWFLMQFHDAGLNPKELPEKLKKFLLILNVQIHPCACLKKAVVLPGLVLLIRLNSSQLT